MKHRTDGQHEGSINVRTARAGKEQGLGIEEVTARAGVSERLVRHCEARGLIRGGKKGGVSCHRYSHEDVCVLRFARRAHVLGFGMREVAELLSLRHDMHRVRSRWKSIGLVQSRELELHVARVKAMQWMLERLANMFSVAHQPPCPILEEFMELRACFAPLANP